jgi:hypothetical protein
MECRRKRRNLQHKLDDCLRRCRQRAVAVMQSLLMDTNADVADVVLVLSVGFMSWRLLD